MKKKDLSIIIAHYMPIDSEKINPLIKTLESINNQKNNYNIEIGGGLGPLAGKIWRIGLMGHTARKENIDKLINALSVIL